MNNYSNISEYVKFTLKRTSSIFYTTPLFEDGWGQIEPMRRLGMKKTGEIMDKFSSGPEESPVEFTAHILGITREDWKKKSK